MSLLNRYFNTDASRSKLEKAVPQPIRWFTESKDEQGTTRRLETTSAPISLRSFEDHLEGGSFDCKRFNLFDPRCDWLDASVIGAPKFHATGSDGSALTFQMPTRFGDGFPLVPTLDREGQAFSSFQTLLQDRILTLRASLVSKSDAFESLEWFQDLRSYVSESVSLIDTTLHQLYFKAQYSPLPGWKFDPARLGERHGRRLTDKIKWIYQITGNFFNADAELRSFEEVKNLRNHLQHFDPPCLCFTLEFDVTRWLNTMTDVALLAWKMRRAIGSPLSPSLIRMLLAPAIEFAPERLDRPRVAPSTKVGYASTRW